MLNRQLIAFGIPLLVAYLLLPVVFFLLSETLFLKTEYANYLYPFLALSFVSKLSEFKRTDFLKSIFNRSDYWKLRVLENLIYSIPFIGFLCYKGQFFISALLLISVIILALWRFNNPLNIIVPTPFGKKPFEFVIGFRNTFFVYPIAYYLTYISITVRNFNLGVFSLLVLGMICFSYYLKSENDYYVWNYNVSSKDFLIGKMRSCLINITLLSLPIVIALSIGFFEEMYITIFFLLLCYVYLITIILIKYSAYPDHISLPQAVILVLSLLFPPVLIIIIPFLYKVSIKKLNVLLR